MLSDLRADRLSDADRETLLGNLEKIRETADSKVDAKYRVALAAYRTAVGSDTAAIELYLNCMEKVNFEERQKKAADFRDWKRKESDKLSDPGLRLAIRHQLRWLILTLQSTSENADPAKLAVEAQEIVDAIFRDAQKLNGQEAILNQPVTSSVFAKAYDINHVKVGSWPLSPVQLDSVYEDVLLPPYRHPARVAQLRAVWIKRIQQEGAKVEYWKGNARDEKKGSIAIITQSPEYEKFLELTQPKLQWDMEVDLFQNGDEKGAAVRMLDHLGKYIAHPSIREWGDQLKNMLTPKVDPPPVKTSVESGP
jgi:hypothetical protein